MDFEKLMSEYNRQDKTDDSEAERITAKSDDDGSSGIPCIENCGSCCQGFANCMANT